MKPEHPITELPAYALGSLTEPEIQFVAQHLAVCDTCRAEVASLRETAGQLAFASAQVEPPARVKQAILAQVNQSTAIPRRMGFMDWLRTPRRAWGLTALAVILLLLTANLLLWNQLGTYSRQTADLQFQIVNLQGTGPAQTARGVMVVSMDGRYGTLVVDDLPALEEERQYQLWLISDAERTSGGIFTVDEWGYAAVLIDAPFPLDTYTDFGVTIEPKGGSPGPTGEKVLGGSF